MLERIHIWILNKLSRTVLKICFILLALIFLSKYVVTTTVMLLLLLVTDFVIISVSNDEIPISMEADRWNISRLVRVGVVQGILMTIEALALLFIGWYYFDLKSNEGQLYTFSFITLLFFSLVVVFVIREKRHFWSSKPGTIDTVVLAADFIGGAVLSQTGLFELKPLPFHATLFVIGWVLFFSLTLNDYVKYRMYKGKNKNPADR
ncbi:MAG: hypothetical protein LIP01_01865 [Tannerellaceae bacterium]|nr:hypothetical protein [Tannerellaceae bacterium]